MTARTARPRRAGTALALLLPALAALLLLFVAPQALMLVASFGRRTVFGGVEYAWSLANYARAFEPLYLGILARSFGLAFATTVLCLAVGYPVAWWLGRQVQPRYRGVLLVLMVLPFWTSFLVRMYAWVFILRNEGLVNVALGALGVPPLPLLYNDFAVLLGQLYGELPFMVLPLYASIERLDPAVLEAAADLGASPRRVLLRVALPLTRPGVVAGCVLVFVPSLGAYLAPDLLGGGRTMYVGNLIQQQFVLARDLPFGSALSFVLLAAALVAMLLLRRPLGASRPG